MSFPSVMILALAMSTDAFAAALAMGARQSSANFLEALRTGIIFGGIEAVTPLIGWALGRLASTWIAGVDHWVAFSILAILGLKMIHEGFGRGASNSEATIERQPTGLLVITAIGTSIDAMAVGVTLALIDANIIVAAIAIGFTSAVLATAGVVMGRMAGMYLGRLAELAGGVLLIVIGARILLDHLTLL